MPFPVCVCVYNLASSAVRVSLHLCPCVTLCTCLFACTWMGLVCVAPCLLWPASNRSLDNRTAHNYSLPRIQEQMAHTDLKTAWAVKLCSECVRVSVSVPSPPTLRFCACSVSPLVSVELRMIKAIATKME